MQKLDSVVNIVASPFSPSFCIILYSDVFTSVSAMRVL
jgi:hypothetical protein